MSLLKRLLGKNDPPKERVRICVECGMPIAQHKDWCSIYQIETKLRAKQTTSGPPGLSMTAARMDVGSGDSGVMMEFLGTSR